MSVIFSILVISGIFAVGETDFSFAGGYQLPDTGIHKCYDTGKEIPCPSPGEPFYGQDAQYHGHEPAYQDNGDGTVTDLNTGLMWQKGDTHNDSRRTWQEACDYCEGLTLAGYSDWRIPDRRELFSIVDFGSYNPAINPLFDCRSYEYWSGSDWGIHPGTDAAWYVCFDNGYVEPDRGDIIYNKGVRCVRGRQSPPPLFQDNSNGTVTDMVTGLMWQKGDDQNDSGGCNWQEALEYCESLDLAGHKDWRLPNIRELESIVDWSRYRMNIDPVFDCRGYPGYWSGSTYTDRAYTDRSDRAWFVEFDWGFVGTSPNSSSWEPKSSHSYYVRCVRRGECTSSSLSVSIQNTSNNFTVNKGELVIIKAKVTDNCGVLVSRGQTQVLATFSNGDPQLELFDDGTHHDEDSDDGIYANTWIPINVGDCTINVNANNTALGSGSDEVEGNVLALAPLSAVAVGIADYWAQGIDVPWSDDSAVDMSELLQDSDWDVNLLTNSDAPYSAVMSAISNAVSSIDPNDNFLFLFCGHGSRTWPDTSLEAYLLWAYDTVAEINDIKAGELAYQLDMFSGKSICIILDACHSGGFIDYLQKSNYVVLTSCAGNETAVALGELQHGVFTYYLSEGIRTGLADTNGDSIISAEELFVYARPRTTAKCGRNPQFYDGNPDEEFPIVHLGFNSDIAEFQGHIYEYFKGAYTWKEAVSNCESKGAHLVTIGSAEENQVVTNLMIYGSWTWIGFTDQEKEGEWAWITGEPVTYTNWASSEPSNSGNEDYAHIRLWKGTWNDKDNSSGINKYPMSYICEYESTGPNPDIKVNGSDYTTILNQSDTINVTIALENNGQTDNADWWLAANTPFGVFFLTFDGWTTSWVPVYQGPLFYFSPIGDL